MNKIDFTTIDQEFDEKFSVFDGQQIIIEHVTYSIWIKSFLHSAITKSVKEAVEKEGKISLTPPHKRGGRI